MTRAEEVKTLVAAYARQLGYLEIMCAANTGALQKTKLQEAEDAVSQFLNGGKCTITEHAGATSLAKLVMMKMLRIEFPHQSMSIDSIEHEIRKLSKESK